MIDITDEMYDIDIKKAWFQTVTWFWLHREKHRWKMKQIYRWLDTTKQNIHQRLNRELKRDGEEEQLKVVLLQVREDHPEMGPSIER